MRFKKDYLYLLMCVYCVFTVVQNLFEMKSLGTSTIAIMGGGTIVSWIPFLCGDIITEVYGPKVAIKSFTFAAILNAAVVILAQIVIVIPGPYIEQNLAFTQIFSNGFRTAIASLIAFILGNYINVQIMYKMKPISDSNDTKHKLFSRAVLSTIVGQLIDNFVFLVIAFAPLGISVFEMVWDDIFRVSISGTTIEAIIEMCFVPIATIPLTQYIKNKPD